MFSKVLEQKEARYRKRLEFEQKYAVVGVFSLNVPYLYRCEYIDDLRQLFAFGLSEISELFKPSELQVFADEFFALIALKSTGAAAKAQAMDFEERHSFSRLYDLDIYENSAPVRARETGRKCFICSEFAAVCIRKNSHKKEQIWEKIDCLIDEFFIKRALNSAAPSRFAKLAQKALLYEISLTPKIGLVDFHSSNSHKDMDFHTFLASISALGGYFASFCALARLSQRREFIRLRRLGVLAESAMYEASKGVNTHKGALFLFAVLLYACEKSSDALNFKNISSQAKKLCENLCENDFKNDLKSAGAKAFRTFGIKGIRAEAEGGFLQTKMALDFYRAQKDHKELRTLFYISSIIDDTCLLKRCGYEMKKYQRIKRTCKRLSENKNKNYLQVVARLNTLYVKHNLSFGGSADVLSLVIFLDFLNIS